MHFLMHVNVLSSLITLFPKIKNTLPFNVAVFSRDASKTASGDPVILPLGGLEREKTFHVPLEVLARHQRLSFAVG